MQILLFILKVIGIILLILLGLIALVLTLVLFVPIRYEVSGEIEDEHKIEAGGVVKYLFSILKIVIAYRNGKLETDIYLFGFRKKKNVLEESEVGDFDDTVKDIEAGENLESDKSTEVLSVPAEAMENITHVDIPSKQHEEPHEISEDIHTRQSSKKVDETVKPKKEKKVKTKPVKKTKDKENKFPFELIKNELTDKHNHNVLKKVFRALKYLLSHFGFRKIKTNLMFGLGDPALTGQILGILAMFPILYHYEFGVIPDFETDSAYIKGTFSVVGRIRLIHVLIIVCRLIFDKEVRTVVKKFIDMGKQ